MLKFLGVLKFTHSKTRNGQDTCIIMDTVGLFLYYRLMLLKDKNHEKQYSYLLAI